MNDKIFGFLLIGIGLAVVIWDLWPIYLYKISSGWPVTEAKVLSVSRTGFVFRLRYIINYSYSVQSANLESTQIVPKDSWVEQLKADDKISIRYNSDQMHISLIDHFSGFAGYIVLAIWNSLLIVIGACLVMKKGK
jgi:hypothetical protein